MHNVPELAAAWVLDANNIQGKLHHCLSQISKPDLSSPLLHGILSLATSWMQQLQILANLGKRNLPKSVMKRVNPPYSLKQSHLDRTDAPQQRTFRKLHFATFGWWEIHAPTQQRLKKLLDHLSGEQIDVCAVTGLQSGLAIAAIIKSPYVWLGQHHDHSSGSGFLIHTSVSHHAQALQPHSVTSDRVTTIKLDAIILQAVYGPHIGKYGIYHHKDFRTQETIPPL